MVVKHKPRKRFGQHFLINESIAEDIVDAAGILPDETVLEIGPGKGVLTERLIKKAGNVFAVEIDRDLASILRVYFHGNENFHLIEADVLTLDIGDMFNDTGEKCVVVSNLPYYISTPVIELLIRHRKYIDRAILMLQKEVAQRLLAGPGTKAYGLTTLNLGLWATGSMVMEVSPDSFSPPPEVDSSVIRIKFSDQLRFPLKNEKTFRTITGAAFRQRRKKLRNNLMSFLSTNGASKIEVDDMFQSLGIDPSLRPENLSIKDFVRLSNAVDSLPSLNLSGE